MKNMIGLLFILLLFIGVSFCPSPGDSRETITITDIAGRKVLIPKEVNRVIPLGSALRFLVYMQSVDKVVGIEAYEKKNKDNPGRPYSLAIADKVDRIPSIGEGGPGKLPDFERVIAAKPDVILTMGLDIALVDTIQQKTGISVIVLSYGGRGVLDADLVSDSLRLLGRILNRIDRAESLISYMEGLKIDLQRRTSTAKERPPIYVGAVSLSGRHGITSTQCDYLPLLWIRGNNVADQINKKGPIFIDKEKILQWDPEILFIDTGGIELVRDDYRKNPEYYKRLRAVGNGRVYTVLPFNFYHSNLEIALANAYYMGKVVYPSHFKDIEPSKRADEIFRFFNGIGAYERLKKDYLGFVRLHFSRDTIELR